MSFPDIGTVNPAHQLETTSNVKAHSLEIYSDYTFFSSPQYDYARQLRFRVKTPTSTNAFVDMGIEKDGGSYFYMSKPLTSAGDPKNNFRIYSNGRVLINRTDDTRTEKLQVGGDVKVTGNVTVNVTTTVSGNVTITGNLDATSLGDNEKHYVIPVDMIVMWDGAVAAIPPGWALVPSVSGYYLKSNPNQTSVQTINNTSFTINNIPSHSHTTGDSTSSAHSHDRNNSTTKIFTHGHYLTGRGTIGTHDHSHSFLELGKWENNITDNGEPNVSVVVGDVQRNTYYRVDNHSHEISYATDTSNESGASHSHGASKSLSNTNGSHTHNNLSASVGTNANAINVPLTPIYREIRLIKKLAYQ